MRAHPAGPRHADVLARSSTAGPCPTGPTGSVRAELHALHPAVWPRGAHRGDDGAVRLAGVEVGELAETYGTPLFVVDEADFRARCAEHAAAFGAAQQVHYAAKAFLCSEIVRWVAAQGLSLDVCTGTELALALHAGFPAHRIAMHGNNKSAAELTAAVAAGVGAVVLDSFLEIARLDDIARRHGVVQPVLVRVTVGVEAHTHEFIATAHEDQKFGFSLATGDAAEAVRRVLKSDGLRLVGLHSHIGSQIFDSDGFELAAHRMVGLLEAIRG
ncbi:MAG TPA: diaminopimelate decarboxylase, partial [Actinophytocola sp.]|nr:diaminopimelate decarboxylase [Actinophytocola sp.]